jgi:glycosyltransferase involved in cell wall biosynthesis
MEMKQGSNFKDLLMSKLERKMKKGSENRNPLVSIIMPFFNPGLYLIPAVKSVFAQTLEDWELIAIDDGSTDGSAELLGSIKDPRIVLIQYQTNKGQATRRNQAISIARGQYIALLDADDIMHPNRLEKQLFFLRARADVDVVATGAFIIDLHNNLVGLRLGKKPSVVEILERVGYVHPTIVAKREWFLKNRYQTGYPRAEDKELIVRTASTSRYEVISEPLYFYRWYGNMKPKAMLQGYKSERHIMLMHGPKLVGWPTTGYLLVKSLGKSMALYLLSKIGQENMLARKGLALPTEAERKSISEIITRVLSTSVPGWDTDIS